MAFQQENITYYAPVTPDPVNSLYYTGCVVYRTSDRYTHWSYTDITFWLGESADPEPRP